MDSGLLSLSSLLNQANQYSQPTPEEQAAARKEQINAFLMNLIGARKGEELDAVRQGGLLSMKTYNDALARSAQRRSQTIGQAAAMQELQTRMQAQQDAQGMRQTGIDFEKNNPTGAVGQAPMQQQPALPPGSGGAMDMMGDAGTGLPGTPPMPQQPQQQAPQQQMSPKRMAYEREMLRAQAYSRAGYVKEAQAIQAHATEKLLPKPWKEFDIKDPTTGQPAKMVIYDDDSREIIRDAAPLEKLQHIPVGNRVELRGEYSGQAPAGVAPIPIGQSPDNAATTFQSDVNSRRADQRARDLNALKQQELQGTDGPMSPEAISNAAARYNIDGTLPPMGMGKVAGSYRSAILNEAAKQAQAQGLTGEDLRVGNLKNKADVSALTDVTKRAANIGAFEKNFNKNADVVLEQSQKVDRTGVPIVNKWLQAGKRAVTGDPDLVAYDTVIKATVNEYAKIVSGSMGNTSLAEGEIKKVEGLLASAQTPEQVLSVVNMMKRETANRMAGFDEEKSSIVQGMRSKKTTDGWSITPK